MLLPRTNKSRDANEFLSVLVAEGEDSSLPGAVMGSWKSWLCWFCGALGFLWKAAVSQVRFCLCGWGVSFQMLSLSKGWLTFCSTWNTLMQEPMSSLSSGEKGNPLCFCFSMPFLFSLLWFLKNVFVSVAFFYWSLFCHTSSHLPWRRSCSSESEML